MARFLIDILYSDNQPHEASCFVFLREAKIMVEIKPFKGIRYNKEKIVTLDDVMSPPYDIIPPRLQDQLYEKHDNNFVKIIFGKQFDEDTEENNRYTRAKQLFSEWQQQVIFSQDEEPALYAYKITYEVNGISRTMNGFFCRLKLDADYKLVKAHERTLSKAKADRLEMMRACQANLEPIQLLYIDEADLVRKTIDDHLGEPVTDVVGYDGFRHVLYKITDPSVIETVSSYLDDEILFIADGHHRYQTAINYAKEMKEKTGNSDPDADFNYRMVILANMFDEGLSIFPTHRFVKKEIDLDDFLAKVSEDFSVEKHSCSTPGDYASCGDEIMKTIESDDNHCFALYKDGEFYVLTLKEESTMDELAGDHSETWRTLDVSILHKAILEKYLGINENNLQDHIKYTRENDEAIEFVDDGTYDFSILMNATKIEELKMIADGGEHMPQKSTYFLPKMLSGLVMYKMDI